MIGSTLPPQGWTHPLIKGEVTPIRVALDSLGRARAEVVLPKVTAGYHAHQREALGPRHAEVGVVDLAYVFHGALGVGLNRWRLRPEDLPGSDTFELREGWAVELVEVLVGDQDMADACLLATECNVEVALVFSCALATGLAKLAGDVATCGPFLLPAPPSES